MSKKSDRYVLPSREGGWTLSPREPSGRAHTTSRSKPPSIEPARSSGMRAVARS
jgi:hypothetical protein